MNRERTITAKYLADLAGSNPELVRRYVKQLRMMIKASGSSDFESAQR